MQRFRRTALQTAAALAAISFCGAMSSGSCISVFYAQTGRNSWLGIGLASLIFALLMGGLARLKRRTGAGSLHALYICIAGRGAGTALAALHAGLYALALRYLVGVTGNAAALMLPFHGARFTGVCLALLVGMLISRRSAAGMRICCGACWVALVGFLLALLIAGRMPEGGLPRCYVELKLEKSLPATVLLAAVHAALSAGVCAAAALRLFPAQLKPAGAGLLSAAAFALPLLAGNGVFALFPEEIIAMQQPFAAVTDGWGRAGYHICALLRWLEGTICIAGIFCMVPKAARGKNAENRC